MTRTPYFDEYEKLKSVTTKKSEKVDIKTIKSQLESIISHYNTGFTIDNDTGWEIKNYLEYLKKFNNIQNYNICWNYPLNALEVDIQPTPALQFIRLEYSIV